MLRKFSAILAVIVAGITLEGGGVNAEEASLFKDHSLVLDGLIGVNFYTTNAQEIHHITFTVEGRTDDKATQTVNASDAATPSGTEYKFTCYVAAPEIANTITATLYDSQGEFLTLQTQTYSVQQYIDEFRTDSNDHPGKYPDYTVKTVEAIADYGHYALEYLAESKGWTQDDSGKYNGMFKPVNAAHTFTADDWSAAKNSVSGNNFMKNAEAMKAFNVKDIDVSLNLDFGAQIFYYITVSDDFSADQKPSGCEDPHDYLNWIETQDKNIYMLKSHAIPAHRMNEGVLNISTQLTLLAMCSPLGYVNAVLNSDAPAFSTNACKNAMTAIYRYYYHARQYQYQMMSVTLDAYDLKGALAYTGTSDENGDDVLILIYNSNTVGGEFGYIVIDALRYYPSEGGVLCTPLIGRDDENQVYTYDNGSTDLVSNPITEIDLKADYTLTPADPREILFSLLIKGYELPK